MATDLDTVLPQWHHFLRSERSAYETTVLEVMIGNGFDLPGRATDPRSRRHFTCAGC